MVREEFRPRKSLRDEGITKIIGEGKSVESIKVIVEHDKGDKQPITVEIQKEWYGDTREGFKAAVEAYDFGADVVSDLDREVGMICLDMIDLILRERQIIQRQKQQSGGGASTTEQSNAGGGIETESSLTAVGDWNNPISVKQANYAKPNSVITVYGQIVTKTRIHSMVKGGQYQCPRCHLIQYIEYERRSYPGDDEAPVIMNRMCRDCGEENLEQGSQEYQQATRLHRVGIEDVRTIDVELMDAEAFEATDTLKVKLFDQHAKDVKVGEYAIIKGKFYLQSSSRNRRMYYPTLHAHDIRYTSQAVYEPKPEDFARVRKFVELASKEKLAGNGGEELGENNVIRRLVFCYSRHRIVWNEPIKEALLYAEASAGPDVIGRGSTNERRKRIHVGIVGNKGVGKSKKARSVLYHNESNRFESAQGSSGKSMTAIVSKEGDSSAPILRIGSLAFAKEAVIVLNEFAEVSLEEQVHFQDAMEEGLFTINKHGIHAIIRADAVVVWTANPIQGASFSRGVVSLDQIAVRKQIIDRTDLLIIDRPVPLEKRALFNHLRMELEKAQKKEPAKWKILCNYDEYVKIHLMVARRLVQKNGEPQLTDEASQIIEQADARIQEQRESDDVSNAGSNRSLDTLLRLSTVIAMLKLKDKVEPVDAIYAVQFYNEIVKDVQAAVQVPEDPAMLAAKAMEYILQNESMDIALTLKTLAELASMRDPAIKWYLYQGPKNKLGDLSTNKRLRQARDMLLLTSSGRIKQTNSEETEFLWVGEKDVLEQQSNTNEWKNPDSADSVDQEKTGERAAEQLASPDIQIKMASHIDMPKSVGVLAEKSQSAESAESATRHKNRPEEREYKILKACEMARANYKDSKAQLKEAGALFETYDVWYHLSTEFPKEKWDVEKVRRAMQEQVKKGRVLTRHEDQSDKWYLNWSEDRSSSSADSAAVGGGANVHNE